ncbi:hypothetical protein A9Z61_00030 [Moraxella osloensis]|nr:hypothetical protein A9Z61_00030 [Moraxella osloensis]
MNELPKLMTIKEILSNENYVIPIYQRNYAWADEEINQLIEDIINYTTRASNNENYYIGSLIVFKRTGKNQKTDFEVIDGQQRFSTLTLLTTYLKNHAPKLDDTIDLGWFIKQNIIFDNRQKSTETLNKLFEKEFEKRIKRKQYNDESELNPDIISGYKIIESALTEKLTEHETTLSVFCKYLFNNVKILRIEVPEHTDLNHYFEVMNNRGEQLEKHEVLKAKFLSYLAHDSKSTKIFNDIWESVANMEKYVQTGFDTKLRTEIFDNSWADLVPNSFKEIADCYTVIDAFKEQSKDNIEKKTLHEIIHSKETFSSKNPVKEDEQQRFGTVINFPSFLLHVLRVFTQKNVSLDDKALLTEFDEYLFNNHDEMVIRRQVKKFAYQLLKTKYLFDTYIIKREREQDNESWEIQYYTKNKKTHYYKQTFESDLNRQIMMLLASFHVSIPSMNYKYWLNGSLQWLSDNYEYENPIDGNEYLHYLLKMANSFLFDRYLVDKGSIDELDYYHIIYSNHAEPQRHVESIEEINRDLLIYKYIKNNFVFNYLDYLIWKKNFRKNGKDAFSDFDFSFRSSVEHFYSQTADGYKPMPIQDRDSFGNLFLISHSQNSSFSNNIPAVKLSMIKSKFLGREYVKGKENIPNLKMLEFVKDVKLQKDSNDITMQEYQDIIKKHEEKMLQLFVDNQI